MNKKPGKLAFAVAMLLVLLLSVNWDVVIK